MRRGQAPPATARRSRSSIERISSGPLHRSGFLIWNGIHKRRFEKFIPTVPRTVGRWVGTHRHLDSTNLLGSTPSGGVLFWYGFHERRFEKYIPTVRRTVGRWVGAHRHLDSTNLLGSTHRVVFFFGMAFTRGDSKNLFQQSGGLLGDG